MRGRGRIGSGRVGRNWSSASALGGAVLAVGGVVELDAVEDGLGDRFGAPMGRPVTRMRRFPHRCVWRTVCTVGWWAKVSDAVCA